MVMKSEANPSTGSSKSHRHLSIPCQMLYLAPKDKHQQKILQRSNKANKPNKSNIYIYAVLQVQIYGQVSNSIFLFLL